MEMNLRSTSLINPFEMHPEKVEPVRHRSGASSRATPVCSSCSSDDVICHATVQWSNEAQEWQIANTFGQPAHCNNCANSCSLSWLTLN
jgi:hypothetical protein